jgi:hypothetical protein
VSTGVQGRTIARMYGSVNGQQQAQTARMGASEILVELASCLEHGLGSAHSDLARRFWQDGTVSPAQVRGCSSGW